MAIPLREFLKRAGAMVRPLFCAVPDPSTFAPSSFEAIQEIERLCNVRCQRSTGPLLFSDELEMAFRVNTARARAKRMWRDGLLTIGVWCACLAADFRFVSDPLWLAAIAKISFTIPFALFTNEIVRRNFPCLVREGSVALTVAVMQVTFDIALTPLGAVGYAYAQFACIICAAFAVLVMRLRFAYGFFVVSVTMTEALSLLLHSTSVSLATRSFGFSVAVMTAGILAWSTYFLEYEERLIFLLRAREELRSAALAMANLDLARSSQTDFQTGLMNRRALETEVAVSWKEHERDDHEVSAILLDIDHFKKVNDTFGHAYGDLVIARVASLLHSALRNSSDRGVRYGGEEFLILLPNTSIDSASLVAERIRSLVETAGLPPFPPGEFDGGPSGLTVSCGVSCCVPSRGFTAHDLIESADNALYRAKNSGRNQVAFVACGESKYSGIGLVLDHLVCDLSADSAAMPF